MSENEKMGFDEIEKVIKKIESRIETLRLSRGIPSNGPFGFIRRAPLYFSSSEIKMLREQELTKGQEKTLKKLEKKMRRYS
ncbi:MAG: hypothetical protein Q7J07_01445 [Pelolinea sp.]|nr:hypothetical protein [Pelolinea sp.]